ncbi:MAG: tripartite tricarboxylate transporter substrate binding protein [Planctomycetes bacterium]|nr:tripartite tricarboxylate transporter substrate binding protein [Planctomycetota bacterium]
MNKFRSMIATAALIAVVALPAAMSAAEKGPDGYPRRDITVNVPFAAGGGTDVAARGFCRVAEKYIDAKFLVTNVTGAAGWNGWSQTLGTDPDGYNLTVLTINLFMDSGTGKTFRDFTPLAAMSVYPTVIAVPMDSDIMSLEDLIERAKADPGNLRWGLDGLRGVDHINSQKFADAAGFSVRFVPFKGGAESIAAALGGNIDVFTANTPETAGRDDIRTLALMSEERLPHMPDVPTMKELGYDVVVTRFRILGTQADVPEEIVQYLESVFEKAGTDPEWIEFANSVKAEPRYMNRTECIAYLDDMYEEVAPIFQKN